MTTKDELIAFIESRDVELFVGKNYDKYKEKWLKGVEKAKSVDKGFFCFSGNIMAFFLLPAWLGYRKLHKLFWAYVAIMCAMITAEVFLGIFIPTSAYTGALIALSFFMNGFYFQHVQKTIQNTHFAGTAAEREDAIMKVGGTSTMLGIVYAILGLSLIIGTTFLASYIAINMGIDVAEEYQLFN